DMPRADWRLVADAGNQFVEIRGDTDSARRDCAAETGDEGRPAGEKSREAAERLAQVHVFATGLRLPRRKFGIGERAEQRQRAAERPDAENRSAVWQQGRNESRRDEDADADDVGNDDRGGIPWTETPFERRKGRAAEHASSLVDAVRRVRLPPD